LENNSTRASVVDIIERVVSADDNMTLTAPFQAHEFKDATQISALARMVSIQVFFNIFGLFVMLIFFRNVVRGLTIINFRHHLTLQICFDPQR